MGKARISDRKEMGNKMTREELKKKCQKIREESMGKSKELLINMCLLVTLTLLIIFVALLAEILNIKQIQRKNEELRQYNLTVQMKVINTDLQIKEFNLQSDKIKLIHYLKANGVKDTDINSYLYWENTDEENRSK